MGTDAGHRLASAYLSLHADAFVVRERIENPDHFELLFPVRIVDGGDIDAIVELLLIAQDLQQFGNQRRIGDDIFLSEVGVGLANARTVLSLEPGNHGRIPGHGRGAGGLGGSGVFGRLGGAGFSGDD